ncbi:MAG: HAMP domain-containing histidine kinase [Oligoflexia bacterium]|nr:HAMP domain-containing histidine kinase [Oligoflexia bacterium]
MNSPVASTASDRQARSDRTRSARARWTPLIPFALLLLWLGFTTSLTAWWYLFGVGQTQKLMQLERLSSPALDRHVSMLRWEGMTLVGLILVGAAGIAYYMYREMRATRRLKAFFSTFTHELKTPLASLRLQAESLKEDLSGSPTEALAQRLVGDTQRLTLQLENSLYLAEGGELLVYKEPHNIRDFIQNISEHWPGVNIKTEGDGVAQVDARAFECILRNLIQNAVVHGRATCVAFGISHPSPNIVRITVMDDGIGFSGDRARLGKLFSRHYGGSGNGIGLYLVRQLSERLGGRTEFLASKSGSQFLVQIDLPGAPV